VNHGATRVIATSRLRANGAGRVAQSDTAMESLRVILKRARIGQHAAELMTGDELVVALGAEATYEVVEALDEAGKTIAHSPGRPGRRCPDPVMRERNLRILSMRLREHRNCAEIARDVGISGSRVKQVLYDYFGTEKEPVLKRSVLVPAESMPVVRDAIRSELATAVEALLARLSAGGAIASELYDFDMARGLLEDVEADEDAEIRLVRRRGAVLVKALRDQLAILRDECSARRRADGETLAGLLGAILS